MVIVVVVVVVAVAIIVVLVEFVAGNGALCVMLVNEMFLSQHTSKRYQFHRNSKSVANEIFQWKFF